MPLEMSRDMSLELRFPPSAEKLIFVAQAKYSVARAIFSSAPTTRSPPPLITSITGGGARVSGPPPKTLPAPVPLTLPAPRTRTRTSQSFLICPPSHDACPFTKGCHCWFPGRSGRTRQKTHARGALLLQHMPLRRLLERRFLDFQQHLRAQLMQHGGEKPAGCKPN